MSNSAWAFAKLTEMSTDLRQEMLPVRFCLGKRKYANIVGQVTFGWCVYDSLDPLSMLIDSFRAVDVSRMHV